MKQSSLDLNLSTKKTRKQELLVQMDRVVPWAALIDVIAPYYPEGKNGRPPFALETMLRIHCMQQCITHVLRGVPQISRYPNALMENNFRLGRFMA